MKPVSHARVTALVSLSMVYLSTGFSVRLWPTNAQGTAGFVEAYYDGVWGFVGSPTLQFTDATAVFLCKTLGLSQFGYGTGYTSMENYTGLWWLWKFECIGNETDIEHCSRSDWLSPSNEYNGHSSNWNLRYGSKLYCVDSRLDGGVAENSGTVHIEHMDIDDRIKTLWYDGFNMNAAHVLCNHLRYDGAVSFSSVEPGTTPIFNRWLYCEGTEYSLTECPTARNTLFDCTRAVSVTCKAVRLSQINEYTDEGAVEVYHKGSWGFVGDPGFTFNDVTVAYLCNRFGLGSNGFSSAGHSLETYFRKAWLTTLTCTGSETDVMQCDHSEFSYVPGLMYTYMRGTWLYCFDFEVIGVRLNNGSTSYEGIVELEINGRWGTLCTYDMSWSAMENTAEVICKTLGYDGMDTVLNDTIRNSTDLIWMSSIYCYGHEASISECHYTRGSSPYCFSESGHHPLTVRCIDIDECMSDPCLNGGTCLNGDQTYTCTCPEIWGGDICEIDIFDNCKGHICFNNGTCSDLTDGYECICQVGFDGNYCEKNIDECMSDPCLNGGTCLNGYQTYTCTCPDIWGGDICEIDIFDDCKGHICFNNGTCSDLIDGYECICQVGFDGNYCEKIVETGNQSTLIIAVIVASCALLVGIALNVWCCHRCRRTTRGSEPKRNDTPKQVNNSSQARAYENPVSENKDVPSNIYNSVKEKDEYDTVVEDVYAEIKEVAVEQDDYLTPRSGLAMRKDEFGYLSFEGDDKMRYYNLKDKNVGGYKDEEQRKY